MKSLLHATAISLLISGACMGAIINVPGDYPTIQGAVDAAVDGDEVRVAPGTYSSGVNNVVDMLGKAISLRSTNGPAVTFIDGENTRSGRRGIICQGGETEQTIIEGFSITNCFASWYDWDGDKEVDYWEFFGGGMWNRNGSSPTVINCRFTYNYAEYGGGICNFDEAYSANEPTLIDCYFEGNTAGAGVGGGIYNNSSSPPMTGCSFIDNSADYGGGVLNAYDSNPLMTDCTFTGNSATADAGGVYNDSSMPTLVNCSFTGNTAGDDGGAVFNADPSSSQNIPVFQDCTFTGNTAIDEGGAMHNFSVSPVISNATFRSNGAGAGGGIYSWNSSSPRLSFSEFCGNTPTHIEGAWTDDGDNEFIDDCETCDGDIDGSGHVGVDDMLVIIAAWASDDDEADLNEDGIVGVDDLLVVIGGWGNCP